MIARALGRLPKIEAAIVVAASAILTSFTMLHAPVQASPDAYSSYDAAPGGYRGLFELARREGLTVDRFERHAALLDGQVDTLVYAEPPPLAALAASQNASDADARALEAWVRSGGNLVYLGTDDVAARERLLGLPHSAPPLRPRAPFVAARLRALGVERLGTGAGLVHYTLPRGAGLLVDDGRGPVALRYTFGRGSVAALADPAVFDNANLAAGDRARLALALLRPASAGGTVAFDETAHGHLVPERWYEVVPRAFVVAALAGVAIVGIAIFGAAIRLGPAVVPPPPDDRTSADFIDALSTLLERGRAVPMALGDAAASATRLTARAAGLDAQASPAEIERRISSAGRRADFAAMQAVAREAKPSQRDFVHAVALAQRLRKDALTHGR